MNAMKNKTLNLLLNILPEDEILRILESFNTSGKQMEASKELSLLVFSKLGLDTLGCYNLLKELNKEFQ